MMDKVGHDTRVWHLPYHSLPTPDISHIPDLTRRMNQNGPGWTTVSTAQSTFTGGNRVGNDSILAQR